MSDALATFFSYGRDDSEFALRLAEDLKAAGANVWIDQLDVQPGMPWDRMVEDALDSCPCMLVILSPVSVKSENVRDEVSFALSKQKRVIPVLYRDCDVPFRMARLQHIDFRTDYARGLKLLLKALGVGQSPQPLAEKFRLELAKREGKAAGAKARLKQEEAFSRDQALPTTLGLTSATGQLPGNAGLYQRAYRGFERIVLATLKGTINEHTSKAVQAARTDVENQTFQKAVRPEYIEPLKQELDEIFSRITEAVLSTPATQYTADLLRVVSIGRSNAFFKLEKGSGSEDGGGVVA